MSGTRSALAPQPSVSPEPFRARSFAAARRHSTLVKVLKVAIPAGSLVAVTVVGFMSVFNPFSRLPGLTLGPVSMQGSKIAMESPKLTGFRKDKRPYEVTAKTAYQDIRKPNVLELEEMKAQLVTDDAGSKAYLVSKAGLFDTGKEHLDLSQDIRIWTEKNEEVLMRSASVDMKTGKVSSREPVKITTPTLDLEAEGLDLSENGKVMVFTGRVRTRMIPASDPPSRTAKKTSPDGAGSSKLTQAEAGERR